MHECSGHHDVTFVAGPFFVSETVHAVGQRLPPHEHEAAVLHFVLAGAYAETIRNTTLRLGPREVLFKPVQVRHCNRFESTGARTLRVEFRSDPLICRVDTLPRRVIAGPRPPIQRLARDLLAEIRHPDCHTLQVLEGLCLELLAAIAVEGDDCVSPSPHMRRAARRCATQIRHRFSEPVSFTHLALELQVDRSQLAKAFRATYGCTMGDYLRRIRVDHVRGLLAGSTRPLADIALDAGFADQSHCTRTFTRLLGTSPGRWRREQADR